MQLRGGRSSWVLAPILLLVGLTACGPGSRDHEAGRDEAPGGGQSGERAPATTARFRMVDAAGSSTHEGIVDYRNGEHLVRTRPGPDDWNPMTVLTVGGNRFVGRPDREIGPRWVASAPGSQIGLLTERFRFDPVGIVEDLRRSSTAIAEVGSGAVRGESTTTLRLELRPDAEMPWVLLPTPVPSVLLLDVDGQGRLRRLATEPAGTTTVELWDFGVRGGLVPPDPADVVDRTDPRSIPILAGIGPDGRRADRDGLLDYLLTGPFARVTEGRWEHVSWEVWAAPSVRGETCRTLEFDPLPAFALHSPIAPTGAVHRNGVGAMCAPPPGLIGEARPIELLSFGTNWDPPWWYLAGYAAPGVTVLDFEMEDGRMLSIPVDPASGLFVLFDTGPRPVAEIRAAAGDAAVVCTVEQDYEDEWFPYLLCRVER